MGITLKLPSQRDKFGTMRMHCDNECILQEGGTALYLGSSLYAETDLSQWKPSGAFRYAFVLNQTHSVCQRMQKCLGHGQVTGQMENKP